MLPSSFLHSIFITTRNHILFICLLSITAQSTNLSNLQEIVKDREAQESMGETKVGHDLVTEQQSISPLLEIEAL